MKTSKVLGKLATCKVTGFQGVIVADITYLNGCRQLCVKPKCKENKLPNGEYIDIGQLTIGEQVVDYDPKPIGGPQMDCPR